MSEPADFSDFFYDSADGLRLHARIYGSVDGSVLPVVCLPGLTRNARDFHRLALYLSRQAATKRKVVVFDYRGRGQSAYDPKWQNYSIGVELGDAVAGLAALGISCALFIGTSRGGLITQVLAAVRPDLIAGAVLNDIGPVIEAEGLALIRGYLDNPSKPATIDEAVAAQKRVHGAAFPALSEADWAEMGDTLYRMEDGRPVPDYDPNLVKTLTTADPDAPIPTLWNEYDLLAKGPVLVIRGANSRLLSDATLVEMAKRGPAVQTVTIAGQGHAPLLHTGELPGRISAFLDSAEAIGPA